MYFGYRIEEGDTCVGRGDESGVSVGGGGIDTSQCAFEAVEDSFACEFRVVGVLDDVGDLIVGGVGESFLAL